MKNFTIPTKTKMFALSLRYLFLLPILLITACVNPSTITIYPSADKNTDLVYLGRNPDNKQHSLIRVRDITLAVFNTVPMPALDSMHLLNHTKINTGETVLDVGTGTGVQAIFAARKAKHVIATDINPQAGENARFNIQTFGLEDRVEVRVGDLFAPLATEERFDVVLLNLKYPNNDATKGLWKVHERFFASVKNHLKPGGRIYYQFGYQRNQTHVEKMLANNQLYISERRLGPSATEGKGLFLTFEIRALPKTINR